MKIQHHLDASTLLSYSAGALPASVHLVTACHIDWCPQCRRTVSKADAIGGHMLDDTEREDVSSSCRDAVLARLDTALPDTAQAENAIHTGEQMRPALPAPLFSFLRHDLDAVPWTRKGPGVHSCRLAEDPCGASAHLIRVAPGRAIPEHGHGGSELTLVLRGSYHDGIAHYATGDISDLDPETDHRPFVDSKDDCICLIALDGTMKFRGIFGRLLQPFLRL